MKIVHFSQSDSRGGAARASLRLHTFLRSCGVDSRMRVGVKRTDLVSVQGPSGKLMQGVNIIRPTLGRMIMRLQKSNNYNLHSPAVIPSGLVNAKSLSEVDIINLHWVCGEFLSIEDIGEINKPCVWTMHDMWPFCGAEHLAPVTENARWVQGYTSKNRSSLDKGLDVNRWVWHRKLRAWKRPMQLVAPSRWLADCVMSSSLMREWPVTVIPNVVDTHQFQPWDKDFSRAILGLPREAKLVLFGAMGGISDPNKGWDLLVSAFHQISGLGKIEAVIFGQSQPNTPPDLGMPIHWLGYLNDDVTLSLAYSAADVMIVPSRQENLPQSGTEAQSCGCPVVAFDCTGLRDVVANRETGYLATAYESSDLADGIRWVLEDETRQAHLSSAARARALRLWSPQAVMPQYLRLYESVIKSFS